MRLPRVQFTATRITLAVVTILLLVLIVIPLQRRVGRMWRNRAVQGYLLNSLPPEWWWPREWRQELATSWTIGGEVKLGGKKVGRGTISFILEPANRAFSTRIIDGSYSLEGQPMPTGTYRVEVRSDDGPEPAVARSQWTMPFDQGRHKSNYAF